MSGGHGGERQWPGRDAHLRGIATWGGLAGARKRAKQAVPNCDPIVRRLFEIIVRDFAGDIDALAQRIGINRSTLAKWRQGHRDPKLSVIHATIHAVGCELRIVTKKKRKRRGDDVGEDS